MADEHLLDPRSEHRRSLLLRPRESAAVELKSWIDPRSPQGIAKIVRATFALRNQNGGFLVIGVDDHSLTPLQPPSDFPQVREVFHPDFVQQIISRYASQAFEIVVDFETLDAQDYPILSIPGGIVTPVACRADLVESGHALLRQGDIFVRTLDANGAISSARMSWHDLPDLVGRCFDNREADHVRFLTKLLPGLAPEVANTFSAISKEPRSKSNDELQMEILERGKLRFFEVANEREVDTSAFGFWDVLLQMEPPLTDRVANREFLETLRNANPDLTGWPVWLDSTAFYDSSTHPYVFDDAWEAFIYSPREGKEFRSWGHLDFWILKPNGTFYLRRVLQDDLGGSSETVGKTIEPFIAILRTAEALAVGQAFAKALNREDATLNFVFRWEGLKGRHLSPWANPMRWINAVGEAKQDFALSRISLPASSSREAVVAHTHEAILPLTRVFNGYELKEPVIRDLVDRLLDRRL